LILFYLFSFLAPLVPNFGRGSGNQIFVMKFSTVMFFVVFVWDFAEFMDGNGSFSLNKNH